MSTTVLLVRHGQTESNITGYFMGWSNEDISELGYAQAHSISSRLAKFPIASIYTSPLKRTMNTARILAKPHKLEPEVMDDLIEIGLGDWQGLHRDEISQKWPEIWKQSRIDPSDIALPNGESFQQVTERAVRAFNRIVADNTDRQALAVTHDVVIRVLVAHVLGASNSIYRRLEINNASLSIIRAEDDRIRLVTLNDTAHLDGIG
ncbi:MAG: histidine phosphatase family protein [Chloroflexota bacterium]|nr:histidine phosphatase family protein [Chloroflexota bacterium]